MAQHTCAHEGCTCLVSGGDQYCSDYCRDHGDHATGGDHTCGCGHPECQGTSA